jgi:hypothetical protein
MQVEASIVRLELAETFVISRESSDHADVVQVALSHKGTTAYGEGAPVDRYGETAEEKKRVFTYWKNLMSSGAAALLEEKLISEEEVIAMQRAMDELTAQEDSIFFYRFIQATAFNS